jgi:thiol-disulfide isomerase/thioredoxin
MKKRTLVFCLVIQVLLYKSLFAQPLIIIEQNYDQAKLLATQQEKLLLIDFYTTWCVPCKQLDKQVFRDSSISKKVAKDFIVLRYNAENDSIFQLTKKHHIAMYPSAVVLNTEQRIIRQQYGTGGPDTNMVNNYLDFLEKAKQAHRTNFFIKGVSASAQLPYPSFYINYVNRVDVKNFKQALNQYWDTLTNLLAEVPFKIFCYFGGGNDKLNHYFLENRAAFEASYGDVDVKFATSMIIFDKTYTALLAVNRPAFDSAQHLARLYQEGKEVQKYIDYMEQRMLRAEGRWGAAYNHLKALEKKKQAPDEDIVMFCEAATDKCNDKQVLNKAVIWMKKIVVKDPGYAKLAIYGRLLFKTGQKQTSLQIMKKAVEAGKKANEDTKEEEKWILQHFPRSS